MKNLFLKARESLVFYALLPGILLVVSGEVLPGPITKQDIIFSFALGFVAATYGQWRIALIKQEQIEHSENNTTHIEPQWSPSVATHSIPHSSSGEIQMFKLLSVRKTLSFYAFLSFVPLVVIGAIIPGPLTLDDIIFSFLLGIGIGTLSLWKMAQIKKQQQIERSKNNATNIESRE